MTVGDRAERRITSVQEPQPDPTRRAEPKQPVSSAPGEMPIPPGAVSRPAGPVGLTNPLAAAVGAAAGAPPTAAPRHSARPGSPGRSLPAIAWSRPTPPPAPSIPPAAPPTAGRSTEPAASTGPAQPVPAPASPEAAPLDAVERAPPPAWLGQAATSAPAAPQQSDDPPTAGPPNGGRSSRPPSNFAATTAAQPPSVSLLPPAPPFAQTAPLQPPLPSLLPPEPPRSAQDTGPDARPATGPDPDQSPGREPISLSDGHGPLASVPASAVAHRTPPVAPNLDPGTHKPDANNTRPGVISERNGSLNHRQPAPGPPDNAPADNGTLDPSLPTGATPWGPSSRSVGIERFAATPHATAALLAPPATRVPNGRAGLGASLITLALIGLVGNPPVLRWLVDQAIRPWARELVSVGFFAHWTPRARPGPLAGQATLEAAFWSERAGPDLVGRGLGGEANLHWVANLGRVGLLVVAIGSGVALALRGHRGGGLSRWLAAWGAVGLASAATGALSSLLFTLASELTDRSPVASLLAGAGFGGLWALLIGFPVAVLAAVMARPRSS